MCIKNTERIITISLNITKTKTFILGALLIAIVGCKNYDDDISAKQANINADYVGIFERGEWTSNVELTLDHGVFNGKSDIRNFPAIGYGNYSLSGNTITFNPSGTYSTEFDWTLILIGEWNFDLTDNVLIMTKSNGDKYTLTQQR